MSREKLKALKEQLQATEKEISELEEKLDKEEYENHINKLKTEGTVYYTTESEYLSSEPRMFDSLEDLLSAEYGHDYDRDSMVYLSDLVKLKVIPTVFTPEEKEEIKLFNEQFSTDDDIY